MRLPQQQQAERLNRQADNADGVAAESVDGLNKEQAGNNECYAESGKAERCAVPIAAGIEERNKSGQHGVADSAERQAHAVRRDAAKHMAEGQMLAVNHRHRGLAVGNDETDCAQDDGEHVRAR